MSMNRCMDKQNVVFMYKRIQFSFKKKGNLLYAMTGMNFEDVILSEISQNKKTNMSMNTLK